MKATSNIEVTPESVVDSLVKNGVIPIIYRNDAVRELDRELKRLVRKAMTTIAEIATTEVIKTIQVGADS